MPLLLEQRRDLFRLLGALVLEPPSDALLEALGGGGLAGALRDALPEGEVREGLDLVARDLALGPAQHGEIRRDHAALFSGAGKKLAAPWESVYRSPERLVKQPCEADVVRAYATHLIGFEGMGQRPADHAGYELEFVSILLERGRRSRRAREAARAFVRAHVITWMPRWARDIAAHAGTDFHRGVAKTLAGLCAVESALAAAAPAAPPLAMA